MRITGTNILMALALTFTIGFTSCDEGATMDIPGPDIDYQFTYSDAIQQTALRSAVSSYQLVAQSDTIKGNDIESFLSNSGQDYTSIVETATIKNALLTLSEGATFAGIDSIQVRYQLVGSSEEYILTEAAINGFNGQTMSFSDVCVSKEKAFELIKNNIVARIYAKVTPTATVNCFQNGVTYRFTANTVLSVKLSALTEGVLGSSN